MKKLQRSQAFLRKRKMMLVLPLLVIPFLTMAFWALGGGTGEAVTPQVKSSGLNLNLPNANLKEDNMADKLSFYDKADKDSVKRGEYMRSDPYYSVQKDTANSLSGEIEQMANQTAAKYSQRLNPSPYEPSSSNAEQRLMQKLALLQKEINKPATETPVEKSQMTGDLQSDEFSEQITRLQSMLQGMNGTDGEDPEIKQLGQTLDKIIDIQHPQRVKDRLKEKSVKQKEVVFPVHTTYTLNRISLLDTSRQQSGASGFFGIEEFDQPEMKQNAIEAVVNGNQVLVNGAVLRLRLGTDVYINAILIPKGTLLNAIVTLNDERLEATISSIRYGNSLFPVKLEVYDLDGLPGIYTPGSITRDVAKQSADNNLQLLEMASLDPSLKAQLAAADISTVKSLLSRKIKQVKVSVKAGYKVLLKGKEAQY